MSELLLANYDLRRKKCSHAFFMYFLKHTSNKHHGEVKKRRQWSKISEKLAAREAAETSPRLLKH